MRIITYCLDLIFPPRPDELVLRNTTKLPYKVEQWQNVFYLHNFRRPQVKAAITENKYQNNSSARKLLAQSLEKWAQTQTEQIVFVPIPLSKEREKERGYNQVTTILRSVAEPKLTILDNVVVRTKHTKPQTSLNKTERKQNLKNAFAIKKDSESLTVLSNTCVVLVDDVVTTGATFEAARATLAPHLPQNTKLITLALAH